MAPQGAESGGSLSRSVAWKSWVGLKVGPLFKETLRFRGSEAFSVLYRVVDP